MQRFLILLLMVAASLCGQPRRIVSTAPSITEMLFAIGAGDRVIGVTTFCHYPKEVTRLPKIGTYLQPNLETVLSLRPDLVVILRSPLGLRERYEAANLKVLELEQAESIAGIHSSIDALGKAVGLDRNAQALQRRISQELAAIRSTTAPLPRTRMMFLVGRSPGALEGMIAVGKASYLNEVVELAGGENVFRDAPVAYPKISIEEVLARSPKVIVDMGEMAETTGVTDAQKRAVVEMWKRFPGITAVGAGRIHAVASDIFVVPGPRVVDAAREFARLLHPEAFR